MARNPIIVQRELAAKQAAAAKLAPPPPPMPDVAGDKAEKAVKPVDPRVGLETLPDVDLKERCKTLFGTDWDPDWDRDTMITKLLEKGAQA